MGRGLSAGRAGGFALVKPKLEPTERTFAWSHNDLDSWFGGAALRFGLDRAPPSAVR